MTLKKPFLFFFITLIMILSFASCKNSFSTPQENNNSINAKIHIKKSDYNKNNLSQFLATETPEEMAKLSFFTNEPIQVEITDNRNLIVKSYAPVTIKNVIIKARTKSSANSYTNIAFFDEIYGFSKSIFQLPSDITFTNKNIEFKITADGDYWQKIQTIKYPLKITFAQDNGGPWKPMSPLSARKAVIVGTTMSYMFNHKNYKEHLKQWNEGGYVGQGVVQTPIPGFTTVLLPSAPFKDDNGNPLSYETVYNQAINRGTINFSLIKESEPAGGIGGGNTLGLREYLFDNFLKYKTMPLSNAQQKDLRCYTVDVIFHELAHCMGYFHPDNLKDYKGTMTYGGGWTTVNYVFLNKLVENGDLPVPLDGKWAENTGFPAL